MDDVFVICLICFVIWDLQFDHDDVMANGKTP